MPEGYHEAEKVSAIHYHIIHNYHLVVEANCGLCV